MARMSKRDAAFLLIGIATGLILGLAVYMLSSTHG
jgi:hypothetical protein